MPDELHSAAKRPGTARDSVRHTLLVALGLSLVCSILVASTAVLLKPVQLRNEQEYRQRIILEVAGLSEADAADHALIEPRMVELATGNYVASPDPADFDALVAAGEASTSMAIPPEVDLAGIRRRALVAPVYLVRRDGQVEQVILPIYGSGLWSTMFGYLALATDGTTIRGLRFYAHAETPGLGDQIDNARWREQWEGKSLFGPDGLPRVEVVRGLVAEGVPESVSRYQVDGLSGATLTGRGVTRLLHYWTGPQGFGPYLKKVAGNANHE